MPNSLPMSATADDCDYLKINYNIFKIKQLLFLLSLVNNEIYQCYLLHIQLFRNSLISINRNKHPPKLKKCLFLIRPINNNSNFNIKIEKISNY